MDQFYFEDDGYFESRYFVYTADATVSLSPYLEPEYLVIDYLETRGSYSLLAIDFDVVIGSIVESYGSLFAAFTTDASAVKTVSAEVSVTSAFTQTATVYRLKDIDLFAFTDAALAVEVQRLRDNNISASSAFAIATDITVSRSLVAEPDSLFDLFAVFERSRATTLETQAAFSFDSSADRTRDAISYNEISVSLEATAYRIKDGVIDISSSATLDLTAEIIASAESNITSTASLSVTAINLEGVELLAFTNATVSATANYTTQASSSLSTAFSKEFLASYRVGFKIQPMGFNASVTAYNFKPGNIIFEKIGTGLAEIDNGTLKLAKVSTSSGIIRSTVDSSNYLYYSIPTTSSAPVSTGWQNFDISFDFKVTNTSDSPGVFLRAGLDNINQYHSWTIGSVWSGFPTNARSFELKVWQGTGSSGVRTFTFHPRLGTAAGSGYPDWTQWQNLKIYSTLDGFNGTTPVITLRYQVNGLVNQSNDIVGSARDISSFWTANNEQIELRNDTTSPLWLDNVRYTNNLPTTNSSFYGYVTPYPTPAYKGFNLTFDGTFNQIYAETKTAESASTAAFSVSATLSGPVKAAAGLSSQFTLSATIGTLNDIDLTAFTNASLTANLVKTAQGVANANIEATVSTQSIRLRFVDSVLETTANIAVDTARSRDITSEITAFTSLLGIGVLYEPLEAELDSSFDTLRRFIEDDYLELGYFERRLTDVEITAEGVADLDITATVSASALVDYSAIIQLDIASAVSADVNVIRQLAADISSQFTTSSDPTSLIEAEAALSTAFSIEARAITTDQIALVALSFADLAVDFDRYRLTSAELTSTAEFFANTEDSLNVAFEADLASEFTQTATAARTRDFDCNLVGFATQLSLVEITTDIECHITAAFTQTVDVRRFRGIQLSLTTVAVQTASAVIVAQGTSSITSALAFTVAVRDLRIDEIEYRIPGEGWEYRLLGETRELGIYSESRILTIRQETSVKNIDSETREYIIS